MGRPLRVCGARCTRNPALPATYRLACTRAARHRGDHTAPVENTLGGWLCYAWSGNGTITVSPGRRPANAPTPATKDGGRRG